MTVEQAIMEFRNQLICETGDQHPILSIELSKKAREKLDAELWSKCNYMSATSFSNANKISVLEIEILSGDKKET